MKLLAAELVVAGLQQINQPLLLATECNLGKSHHTDLTSPSSIGTSET